MDIPYEVRAQHERRSRQKLDELMRESERKMREYEATHPRAATHQSDTKYLDDELDFSPAATARRQARKQREKTERRREEMVYAQKAERALEAEARAVLDYQNSFPGTLARVLRHVLNKPLKKRVVLEPLHSDEEDDDLGFKFASRKRSPAKLKLAARKRSPAKLKLAARKRSPAKLKLAARKRSHVRLASRKRSPAKLKLASRKRSHKRSHTRLSFCRA